MWLFQLNWFNKVATARKMTAFVKSSKMKCYLSAVNVIICIIDFILKSSTQSEQLLVLLAHISMKFIIRFWFVTTNKRAFITTPMSFLVLFSMVEIRTIWLAILYESGSTSSLVRHYGKIQCRIVYQIMALCIYFNDNCRLKVKSS